MKDIYKTLKEATVLLITAPENPSIYVQNFQQLFKKVYTAKPSEAKNYVETHKNAFDVVIANEKLPFSCTQIAVFMILNDDKLSESLIGVAQIVENNLTKKKSAKMITALTKAYHEEQLKAKKLEHMIAILKHKTSLSDFITDELLVKFEINKDGIVTSTSKNFAEIFGFREEYIVNEDISKIVNGSSLQKALLVVTRQKKPISEYITFNTVTNVIIEPMVAIAPYFDSTGYLNKYTLYCTLQ